MTSSVTLPAVYVGTYHQYNGGSIFGKWFDLTDFDDEDEFYDACRALHAAEDDPEFMFQDWEGIPSQFASESSVKWAFTLAQHYGVMFFYRGREAIDGQLVQVIKNFRETYGLSVIPVSVDGIINPMLPDSRTDQGQAEQLGVKFFPAMMLVNPKSGQVKPLSYGFISQDDLAKQFLYVSSDFKPNF